MKRKLLVIAVVLCIVLCGCNRLTIRGEVVEVDGNSFTMVPDGGEALTVTMGGNTSVFSWSKDVSVSDFQSGDMDGIIVSATGIVKQDTMFASEIQIEGLRIRNYYTLADGTPVHLCKASLYHTYSLEDGEELLFVQNPTRVEETYVAGIGSLRDLPEVPQENIKAYYDAKGLLYDELQTLENAYDAYLAGPDFQTYTLGQETCPAASNEEVIYFLTIVSRPKTELRLCAAFDRETGEAIPMEEIFTCEPREFIQRLAKIAGIDDETLVEEMMEAFQTEYVTVSQNFLEVNFPAGTLPSEELPLGMGFEYTQDVCELIQPWAIPNGVTG